MSGSDGSTRDERRVVTAVFADLVGSTALAERLDPEELKLIVGEAIARIITAVESFGGTIKDLAGDGVLALFGAPTAHEDDPERAVRAALRVRVPFPEPRPRRPSRFDSIRSAISSFASPARSAGARRSSS